MKQSIALFATVLLLSSCSGTRDGAPGVPVIDLAANVDKECYLVTPVGVCEYWDYRRAARVFGLATTHRIS